MDTIYDINPVNEIKSLSNILNRKLYDVLAAAGGENLSSFQLWILCFIDYNSGIGTEVFQKDIEQYFDIRRPTASKLLSSLEEDGFLERYMDDTDNRRKKLVLTDKAMEYLNDRKSFIFEFDKQFLYGISKRELATYMKVTANLKKNLERIRSTRKEPLR